MCVARSQRTSSRGSVASPQRRSTRSSYSAPPNWSVRTSPLPGERGLATALSWSTTGCCPSASGPGSPTALGRQKRSSRLGAFGRQLIPTSHWLRRCRPGGQRQPTNAGHLLHAICRSATGAEDVVRQPGSARRGTRWRCGRRRLTVAARMRWESAKVFAVDVNPVTPGLLALHPNVSHPICGPPVTPRPASNWCWMTSRSGSPLRSPQRPRCCTSGAVCQRPTGSAKRARTASGGGGRIGSLHAPRPSLDPRP